MPAGIATQSSQPPSWEHGLNHNGRIFTIQFSSSGATAVGVLVAPAAGTDLHAIFQADASAAAIFRLYESVPNSTASGSAYTPVCTNRCESRTAKATVRTGVTLNSSGATQLIGPRYLGAGVGGAAQSGASTSRNEWILEAGKKYHFGITGSASKNIEIDFYETKSIV